MELKASLFASVLSAVALTVTWREASAPVIESAPVMNLPALRIQINPLEQGASQPESKPLSRAEECMQMDEDMLKSIYGMLEDFNDEVGTSFGIIAEGNYRFVLAPSNEYPHTFKTAIADAYDDRIQATHNLIQHVREIEKCAMPRSVSALGVFNDITLFYDTTSRQYEANRRNGIITPEMLYYLQRPPQLLI